MAKKKKIIAISVLCSLLLVGVFAIGIALKKGNSLEDSEFSSNEASEREKIALDASSIDF